MHTAGNDRLKEALQALGLKCGGTPAERAKRLFVTKTTPLHQLAPKYFAKGVKPPAARSEADMQKQQEVRTISKTLYLRVGCMLGYCAWTLVLGG